MTKIEKCGVVWGAGVRAHSSSFSEKHRNGGTTTPVSALLVSLEGTCVEVPDKAVQRLPGGSNRTEQPKGGAAAEAAGSW